MHIVDATASRLVFDVENVSTMRYFFIPILHPGELQAMYFLDRESDNVWRYYSIVRTEKNANGLIAGNDLPRSTAPLRSIATWSEFQPPKSRRGRVEDKSCKAFAAAPTLQQCFTNVQESRWNRRSQCLAHW